MNDIIKSTLVVLCLASAAGAQVASVPYVEDFTAGSVGPEWTLFNSASQGRIRFTTIAPVSPLSGGNAMIMDKSPSGGSDVTNQATLRVDLAPTGGGVLRFYFRETSDENDANDGVFISDGGPQFLIVDLQGGPSSWTQFEVDLTQAALANGLNLANIEITFSHQDNFSVPTDGFFFDDIRVNPPPVPDTGQPNTAEASLDVNNGLNLNGQAASIGINGPFFSNGSTLDVTVTGEPDQPWILLLGPLNRNNIVFGGGIGSLDVGTGGGLGDVAFVLDGVNGTSFFDQLARTGATGRSELSFDLAGLPPGVLGAFQAAVLHAGGTQIRLTAAFEFTVQ